MLYEWRKGGETQAYDVPGYIYLILGLGVAGSISNALSYIGACSRSVCLMSTSLCVLLCVLLLEIALSAVLFYKPSLVDTTVCPPDDATCLARVDSIFKDPSAHAGCLLLCKARQSCCPCDCLFFNGHVHDPLALCWRSQASNRLPVVSSHCSSVRSGQNLQVSVS